VEERQAPAYQSRKSKTPSVPSLSSSPSWPIVDICGGARVAMLVVGDVLWSLSRDVLWVTYSWAILLVP